MSMLLEPLLPAKTKTISIVTLNEITKQDEQNEALREDAKEKKKKEGE